MDLFNPLRWSLQVAAWAAPGIQAWTMERSRNRTEGERHLKSHDFDEAEKYLRKAVDEADALRHSVRKVEARLDLAEALRKQRKVEEAERTVREALEHCARATNPSGYVQCLDALAEVYHDAGNYAAMEAALQEGVKLEAAIPHPDGMRMARRVHRLGTARHKNGRSAEAIPPLEKALKLREELSGKDHLDTAQLLSELGVIYRAAGNHVKAQACLRRSLRIHEIALGRDSNEALHDLHYLAASLEETGDIEGASALYERLLVQRELVVGGDLEEFAEMQYGLAGIYIGWMNYARARELLAEAVGIFKAKKNARLAVTHETIAHVEECSGRYLEAIAELGRAAKVWEKLGEERRTELINNLEHRAELLEMLRRKNEAAWLREKAAELIALNEALLEEEFSEDEASEDEDARAHGV